MALSKPKISKSEKFSDHFEEGERFFLVGIRAVKVNTELYGEGEMVILSIRRDGDPEPSDFGIWGAYLTAQAEAVESDDLNQWYVITREVVPEFSRRPVKLLKLATAPGQTDAERPF